MENKTDAIYATTTHPDSSREMLMSRRIAELEKQLASCKAALRHSVDKRIELENQWLREKVSILEAANAVLLRESRFLRMYASEDEIYAAEDAMRHTPEG